MTRRLWLTTAAVAMAAVVTIPIAAQQPQGRGMGRGQAMGMGPGPGGPGPMGMLRGVDLTVAQREQIRTIQESARDAAQPGKMGDLQKQLQLAILADAADPQKIEQLKQAIAAAEADMLARRIDIETRVVQVLTPEQRAAARQNVEKREPAAGRAGRGQGLRPGRGARR